MMKVQIKEVDGVRAVLLPQELELPDGEIYARRDPVSGDVVLATLPGSWSDYFEQDEPGAVPQDYMIEQDRFGPMAQQSGISTLADAWNQVEQAARFPADFDGTATPAAYQATQALKTMMREYAVSTNDRRLSALMHLLGQAALRMKQVLWPENGERLRREIE